MSCIQELKSMGKTVVLVTHKTNLLALSDKTLMLMNGTVEKFGPTKEFFQKPQAAAGTEQAPQKAAGNAPSVVQLSTSESDES